MADDDAGKADGAMLAIGELAIRIGVPTHVLRYWETRFPELRPLQRSGRRRYYRAEDVALAERIHALLHVQGYTVEGARKALGDEASDGDARAPLTREQLDGAAGTSTTWRESGVPIDKLIDLRQRLAAAITL